MLRFHVFAFLFLCDVQKFSTPHKISVWKVLTHLSVLSKIVEAIVKESSTSVFLLADLRFYIFNFASCLL